MLATPAIKEISCNTKQLIPMTKLHNIFRVFECYPPEQVKTRLQESLVYLKKGAEIYENDHAPLDITEDLYFISQLEKHFEGMLTNGDRQYQLVWNHIAISLTYLDAHFSKEHLKKFDIAIKMVLVHFRVVLNSDNITTYNKIAEFYELLSAVIDSMFD